MYKYYLLYNGIKSEIDKEPIGWDGFETTIGRNEKSHGIGIVYSDISLKFYDDISIGILKTAYADDIDSRVLFIVEADDIEEYRGAIDFKTYSENYDNYHYIEVNIGDIGVETTFFNRQEQKVNLDSLVAFDGGVLPSYPFLKKSITLPAKDILFTSSMERSDMSTYSIHKSPSIDTKVKLFSIPFGTEILNEIDDLNTYTDWLVTLENDVNEWSNYRFNVGYCIFRYAEQEGFKSTEDFILKVKYGMSINCTFNNTSGFYDAPRIGIYIVITNANGDIKNILRGEDLTGSAIQLGNVIYNALVDDSYNISMDIGDMIAIGYYAYPRQGNENLNAYDITMLVDAGASFSITSLNKTDDTTANVSFIHETLSRIVEATTNGVISVKSNYYGRTDSNVNPVPQNGEGSLKVVTSGLRIRKATNEDGSEPLLSLSFTDVFKGIQPIDNVGYGFVWENDQRILRVEPYQWFYSDSTILLEINNPKSKKTYVDINNLFSSFKTGYKKFETEGTNGLDAFLTEREYRTRSTVASTKLEQVSEFVADVYAIEATRRLADKKDTKDWRYDNETFVIQMTQNGQEYNVELGVVDSSDVIASNSLYNVRISPVRCALKWLNRLFGWSNKQEELIFTSGKGNITAKTKIGTESQLIGENDNLQSIPVVLKSEVTEFDYPISIAQYNFIVRNPYGIIMLDGSPYYLNELKYKRKSRIANFKVVPKN